MGGGDRLVLKLACAGLPSAGKSTMINSLAGARLLETGVCRTTSEPCVLSATRPDALGLVVSEWKCAEITSDDGVGLCVVDLPGVADAENTGTESNFTEMTLNWAAQCDVVVWVTDVRTCFSTTHEKLEYEKLKATLRDVAQREGKLFQFCVALTKCDATTMYDATIMYDRIERARRMFPDDRMIPFNAFGRVLTRNDASETLKALAGKHNVALKMEWATEDLHERRQAQMLRSVMWHLRASGPSDAMKAYLDESTTAALVLAVLGADDPTPRHRAIAEAVETGQLGPRGLSVHDACKLGSLHHAPSVAATYEREILARYDALRVDQRKDEFVSAMILLCGPSCLVTTRMYLLLPFAFDASLLLVPPRAMSAVLPGYPALFELDVQYAQNPAISAKKSWVEKVRAARVSLWGTDAESDVCVATAIALTAAGVLYSVLARID